MPVTILSFYKYTVNFEISKFLFSFSCSRPEHTSLVCQQKSEPTIAPDDVEASLTSLTYPNSVPAGSKRLGANLSGTIERAGEKRARVEVEEEAHEDAAGGNVDDETVADKPML